MDLSFIEGAFGGVNEDEGLWEAFDALDDEDMDLSHGPGVLPQLHVEDSPPDSQGSRESADTDGDDPEARREVAISGLEQLSLSVMLQLEAGMRAIIKKEATKTKIVIELARRDKRNKEGSSATRRVTFPRRGKGSSSRSLAQLLVVVDAMHEALVDDVPVTKRDIYYRDPKLFKTQATVDRLVDDIAATLQLGRADLNVRASGKGLFCGGLVVHLKAGGSIVGNDSAGSLIPDSADIARFEVPADLSWVLIVEKEAVFRTLCGLDLVARSRALGRGILITGKGYPDVVTRQLVKTLCDNLADHIPVAALVDGDPHGLDILSVYKFGSTAMQHEAETLVAGRVAWLGLQIGELDEIGIDESALIPLSKHDEKKVAALIGRPDDIMPEDWRRELERMLHVGAKAEIEILCNEKIHDSVAAQEHDDSDDQDACAADAGGGVHPLVKYIERKMRKMQVELARVEAERPSR